MRGGCCGQADENKVPLSVVVEQRTANVGAPNDSEAESDEEADEPEQTTTEGKKDSTSADSRKASEAKKDDASRKALEVFSLCIGGDPLSESLGWGNVEPERVAGDQAFWKSRYETQLDVVVEKTAEQPRLGLELHRVAHLELEITAIESGILHDYNKAQERESKKVMVGDRIVQVNAVSGDCEKMIQEIARKRRLKLLITSERPASKQEQDEGPEKMCGGVL
mmetsp:Transcript_83753/g.194841  ORF Transcript_83753/g.194841 Transcript_83753/m.194841 type:complete len:223 (-) Transcript_83753:49-717(-)